MRKTIKLLGLTVILLAFAATTSAHRLDEYLQATRLSITKDRIFLEIDLTPGVDVAPLIFASINTDHDGLISQTEGRTYASRFLKEVALELDGQRQPLTLVKTQFPSFQEMSSGEGTIRIVALATCASPPGRHSLFYQNDHWSDISAYLVNALIPASPNIEITEQNRDPRQRGIHLSFTVKS